MHQNADLQVKFEKFYGGYVPDPHTGEGLRRPTPDPTPVGAPALRPLHHPTPMVPPLFTTFRRP